MTADNCAIALSFPVNTSVNHEPRVEDLEFARFLGFSVDYNIRKIIRQHQSALARLGEIFSVTEKIKNINEANPKGAGRHGKTYWLNKKQAVYIAAKSETRNAVDLTIRVIEVFDEVTSKPITVRSYRRSAPKRLPHDPRIVTLTPLEAHNLRALINTLPRLAEVQKQAEEVLRFARSPLAGPMYEAWHYPQIVLASLGPLLLRCQRAADSSRLTGR